MGERESRDAARSLSVVHYLERDLKAAATLVAGLIERSAAADGTPALVAVLPSPDDALAFSEAVLANRPADGMALTALTSPSRGRRIIASGTSAIAAAPAHLARLVAESRLEFSRLHTLVLVWPEEILADDEQRASLESIIAEVPRTTERVALCAQRTTELAQFLERSMWRAREIDHATPPPPRANVSLRVVSVPPSERLRALRSVLDAFDPESAVLLTFSDEAETAARDAAALLGSSKLIEVSRGVPDRHFTLGVVFDDATGPDVLTAAAAIVDELVAIVRPSRLPGLQRIATSVTPIPWTGAIGNARSAHDALREEIRGYAGSGAHNTWIPIVEPLLEQLDPVDVAAAALALLDRERRKAKRTPQAQTAPASVPDRVVPEDRPGFRQRPQRRDEDRPSRPPRQGGERRDDDRGGRPERGFVKKRPWSGGQRNAADDSRGPRGPRGPRRESNRPSADRRGGDRQGGGRHGGERGGRNPDEIERVPRAAREGREWSERGERLRNSRRGPRGGDSG